MGIPEDEQDRVFEKFERGSGGGVGAGLGLSLVKSLVELHGGDVQLESSSAEGTSVYCRLPNEPQDQIEEKHVFTVITDEQILAGSVIGFYNIWMTIRSCGRS